MGADEISRYVVKDPASGIYRYYRRVPTEIAHLDKRTHVKQSLKTKNLKDALEKAESVHQAAERLWRALLGGNDNSSAVEQYSAAVKAAQSLGFSYKSNSEVGVAEPGEIIRRLAIARASLESTTVLDAVAGTAPTPTTRLSNLWSLYEQYNKAGLTGMSPNQMAKHQKSRERAIRYASEELGDMELAAITRKDVLRFRDWWTSKIEKEKLTAYSANRCFSDIMGMLTVIDDALHSTFHAAWEKARLKETNATKLKKRPPFPVAWVSDKILAAGALDNLNEDGRLIVYTMIESGLRLGEVCNLRPQDIRLKDKVPHLEVAERDDRRQKTEHSIRRVPLVGVALWAMKQRPDGFPRYQDKADAASAVINKVMASAGLRPTDRHTVYSLRHTFQDRIENADCSDRLQADLMGHEFGRPTYGDGPEMERRQKFLKGILFDVPWIEAEFRRIPVAE